MAAEPDDRPTAGSGGSHEFPPSGATVLLFVLGTVGSGLRHARELRDNARKLPLLGLTFALEQAAKINRDYPKYLAQGMEIVQRIASGAAQAGRVFGGDGAPTVVAPPGDETVDEEAREVAERARGAVEKAERLRRAAPPKKTAAAKPATTAAAATPAPPPPPPPPAPAPEPVISEAAREVGAPGAAAEAVDAAVHQLAGAEPDGANLHAPDLPEPELDHLSVPALRARLRRFDIGELVVLRAYEKAHANRLQVVTMLENRIAKLESDSAAS